MASKPIEIAVVGGGIGGLCAAIGFLKHSNFKVQIYEAAHHFSEIGAGVAFGPNAQRALKLIGESTEQAYLRQVTHNQWKEFSNVWFEYRKGTGSSNEGELLTVPKNESGQSTVHRAKFLDEFVRKYTEFSTSNRATSLPYDGNMAAQSAQKYMFSLMSRKC